MQRLNLIRGHDEMCRNVRLTNERREATWHHGLRNLHAEDVFDTVSGTLGLNGGVYTIAILKRTARARVSVAKLPHFRSARRHST
jgi:hypothetical protein